MEKIKAKSPEESKSYIAEIVGDESLMGQRMSAGKLLHMMDISAASAAAKHAESALVTLAFDRVELLDFICHRDYVRYDSTVIAVGRSSMVVMVEGFYKSPVEMEIQKGQAGFITLVAINKDGKPNKNIPRLVYKSDPDQKLKDLSEVRTCQLNERKLEIRQINTISHITSSDLRDYYKRRNFYQPEMTKLTIRKKFLPRNANSLGIVFGGDTIEMMEELALATARQFTGNLRMVTIAMEDILFLKPINLNDIVEMSAQVVFVANTTLVVEITVNVIDFLGLSEKVTTNNGKFTVLNFDRSGQKKKILNGLALDSLSPELKKAYLIEQIKYEKRVGYRPQTECTLK